MTSETTLEPGRTETRASDAELTAWREAYLARGLPRPVRSDRWQVLRAGVANLWEFDTAEYWYADGWVQLTGRNETGKSSLMALTTLIPWLGDVSPNNIDTLGTGRGKQFRYYVEPSDTDGDRRDRAAATNRGWLWVEYGRLGPDGEAVFFTTAGFFEAKRAAQDYRRDWVTVEGSQRVRAGLDLVVARSVQGPAELAKQADGVVRHQTAGAYRSHVAARLFGSEPGVLEAIGKMLRVARTPKLGQALSEHFVTSQLRDSLPSLEPGEVGKLADGWDELDKVRVEVETTKAAVQALRGYLTRAWRPFQEAVLRQSADAAVAARSQLEDVTKRVRAAAEQLEAATRRQAEVEAAQQQRRAQVTADERAEQELLRSSRYRDAAQRLQQVENLKKQRGHAESRVREADAQVTRALARRTTSEQEHSAAQQEVARAAEALAGACDRLGQDLDEAGLAGQQDLIAATDWARLRRILQDRAEQLAHLAGLLRAFAAEDEKARSQEDRAAERRATADQSTLQARQAWEHAEQTRDELAVSLARWAAGVPSVWAVPDGLVDTLAAGLPTRSEEQVPSIAAQVRAQWFAPHDLDLDDRARKLGRRLEDLATQRAQLETERRQLESATDPAVPAPAGLVRRERPAPGPDGAPLWRLLDAPALADAELAAVEGALTAMGLLDVWVNQDGRYESGRDGLDTVLRAGLPRAPGRSLADVVTCVDDAGPRRELVEQVLRAIGWQNQSDYAIWPDGRWQTPERSGRAQLGSGTAELIGETTRQRARARRLALIRDELQTLSTAEAALREESATVASLRGELAELLVVLPTEDALKAVLVRAAERDARADSDQQLAAAAQRQADQFRAAADRTRATAFEYASAHALPTDESDRDRLRTGLSAADRSLQATVGAQDVARRQEQALQQAATRLAQDQDEHERAATAAAAATANLRSIEQSLERVTATLDADTTEVLAEAELLRGQIERGRTSLDELGDEALGLRESVGASRALLESAEHERADRERERDVSYEDFRELLDAHVPDELGLQLPEPQARTVTATRAQVSLVRDQVRPRDWPDEPRAKQERVQRARSRLADLDELRTRLEQGGRTARLTDGARLPNLEIVVDATGAPNTPREAMRRLETIHSDLSDAYDQTMRATLEELLGSTFINHLRERLAAVDALVKRINDVLGRHPTGTTRTVLRITLEPTQGASRAVLAALRGSASLMDEATQTQVREFLRTRIEGARAASVDEGEVDWGERLAEALDYRQWWDVHLRKRAGEGGRWTPVNSASFNLQSGGARVVLLMLPLIATLIALYESTPGAPRPFWLDEAFDGLDQLNRTMVLELLGEFDLDVLLAGPGRLLNSAAVRAGAIFQVVRAEYPYPGADLTCELWAGQELTPLEPEEFTTVQDAGDSLFGLDL